MSDYMLNELIEELNNATGPSLELDCKVWLAIFRCNLLSFTNDTLVFYNTDPAFKFVMDLTILQPPKYTSDIGIAMTLIPGQWQYNIQPLDLENNDPRPFAHIAPMWANGTLSFKEYGANMPLALCAAVLRAAQKIKMTHGVTDLIQRAEV